MGNSQIDYHASMKNLISKFTYFTEDYIRIPCDVKESLCNSHKNYFADEIGLTFNEIFLTSMACPTVYSSALIRSTSERTKIDG